MFNVVMGTSYLQYVILKYIRVVVMEIILC